MLRPIDTLDHPDCLQEERGRRGGAPLRPVREAARDPTADPSSSSCCESRCHAPLLSSPAVQALAPFPPAGSAPLPVFEPPAPLDRPPALRVRAVCQFGCARTVSRKPRGSPLPEACWARCGLAGRRRRALCTCHSGRATVTAGWCRRQVCRRRAQGHAHAPCLRCARQTQHLSRKRVALKGIAPNLNLNLKGALVSAWPVLSACWSSARYRSRTQRMSRPFASSSLNALLGLFQAPRARTCAMEADPSGFSRSMDSKTSSSGAPSCSSITFRACAGGIGGTCGKRGHCTPCRGGDEGASCRACAHAR